MATEIYNFFELTTSFDLKSKDTTRSHALRVSKNSLQRGNKLTPVIPGFILVIPGFILVIPGFILVIPAKAGIHTDSPPEPHCPVPPWP
ncbi:hypothetical protein [Endozoicomonas sp. ALC020]|uniref:hypothetical protein n=1 Tax=unclassified Endozoicomonas TaxID=2644528 RepID=UPI003BAE9A19